MKYFFLSIIFLFSLIGKAQSFNGEYISYKTSFKDDNNSDKSFIEETIYNIAIFIEEDSIEGRIIIQDPRIPKQLIIYKVSSLKGFTQFDDRWIAIYNCLSDHLVNQEQVTLTFYISEQNQLNLLVLNNNSSQMFFNLEKQ